VSDAIACPEHGAARNEVERCTADPGPPQTGAVPGLQRTTPCCAAPGTRDSGRRAFWRNEPNRHFGETNPRIHLGSSPRKRGPVITASGYGSRLSLRSAGTTIAWSERRTNLRLHKITAGVISLFPACYLQ